VAAIIGAMKCRRSSDIIDAHMRNMQVRRFSSFEEFFPCLIARNVRVVVVGGHALAYHGRPRYTKDLAEVEVLGPDDTA